MIEKIIDHKCTGCMMCGDLCPTGAISFQNNNEGFWVPCVNAKKCNSCGLCIKKCPALKLETEYTLVNPVTCYGAWNKDGKIRNHSTSGGVFTAFANSLMENGYYCAGAIYDDNFNVKHIVTKNMCDIEKLRQSKYVQSDTKGIYKATYQLLKKGKQVFFCGTPCQVAALESYLGSNHENLITLDFVCCGISSPKVYDTYKEWLEKKYRSKIKKIWFKNKKEGWRSIGTYVEFENGKSYLRSGTRDPYMISFVIDALNMRECCYSCNYRKIPHCSDITVADFWGVENFHPEFDDNQGISALIINTSKGLEQFSRIKKELHFFKTTVDEIASGNFTIYKAKEANTNRKAFLLNVEKMGLLKAMEVYSSYSGWNKVKLNALYYKNRIIKKLTKLLR